MRQHAFVLSASMLLLAALPAQRRGDGGGGGFGGRSAEPPKLENFTFESGSLTSDKVKDGDRMAVIITGTYNTKTQEMDSEEEEQ